MFDKQRGVALVSAIFLLVVLAALGAYMVTVSGVQQTTVSRGLLNARVYYAARAGLEWGIHRAVAPPSYGGGQCSASNPSFTIDGAGLSDIQLAVNCSSNEYIPGTDTRIYTITSTASHSTAGTVDYAERKLEATVCRANESATDRCGNDSAP